MKPKLLFLLASVLVVGCVSGTSPAIREERNVTPATNPSMQISVPEGMVYTDYLQTRGIRFAQGIYKLEAEDAEYRYFASPNPVEYRVFNNGTVVEDKFMEGGLAVAKKFNLVPGAAYMNEATDEKILTWKLGAEFLNTEGRSWKKNFQ